MDRATLSSKSYTAHTQGEVRGEATFATSAHLATGVDEIGDLWRTPARLEATTRQRLVARWNAAGLDTTPDEAQEAVLAGTGRGRAAAGFAATLSSMAEVLPPFVASMRRLGSGRPPGDRGGTGIPHAHEIVPFMNS